MGRSGVFASRSWALVRDTSVGWALVLGTLACAGPAQRYPLSALPHTAFGQGSVEVERIEGGQHLVVVELDALEPPETLAQGVDEYVVWLEDARGKRVRAGTLRYDRGNKSGNLMATTDLSTFTVRVTAEGPKNGGAKTSVLVAERRVLAN
jgi:hypothetical protein